MNYFIYKTTNTVNGMIYVGVHKSETLDDDYLGSGQYLKRAINTYGRSAFTRTILETFSSMEDAFVREVELVNDEFVDRTDTYNLCVGGSGGPRRNSWAKKDAEAQREHAKKAAAVWVATRDEQGYRERVAETLRQHFAENGSPNKGLTRQKVICPHCGKSGAANTMARWHFDNCKNNNAVLV